MSKFFENLLERLPNADDLLSLQRSTGGLPHKARALNSKNYIRQIACDTALVPSLVHW